LVNKLNKCLHIPIDCNPALQYLLQRVVQIFHRDHQAQRIYQWTFRE